MPQTAHPFVNDRGCIDTPPVIKRIRRWNRI
jgi:hypothetical protein